MLISGLAAEQCQSFFGADAWSELDATWCRPEQLAVAASEQPVLWLYRAPWIFSADDPVTAASSETYVNEWARLNRAVLALRPELGERLVLANIDRVDAGMLQAKQFDRDLPKKGQEPSLPRPGLLAQAIAWCAPHLWDLYEALEASSWIPSGEPQFRQSIAVDEAQLHALCHELRTVPQLQRSLAASEQARKKTADDARTWHANEETLAKENQSLLTQLHQVQEELEQHYLKANERQSETRKAREQEQQRAEASAKQAEQENELLLIQLHQVQEELEQYYLNNLELGKKADEARTLRDQLQKEKAAAKALRTQLKQLQTELRRLKVLTPRPLPANKSLVLLDGRARRLHNLHKWGHFVPRPAKTLLRRSRSRKSVQEQARLVRASGWFDAQWYLQQYPDVRQAKLDPVEHYLSTGWREKRNPGQSFDTAYYLRTNPDIREDGLNPLWHFINYGRGEGRLPRKP